MSSSRDNPSDRTGFHEVFIAFRPKIGFRPLPPAVIVLAPSDSPPFGPPRFDSPTELIWNARLSDLGSPAQRVFARTHDAARSHTHAEAGPLRASRSSAPQRHSQHRDH